MINHNEYKKKRDQIILDAVHEGTMLREGRTINAAMFSDYLEAIDTLFLELIGGDNYITEPSGNTRVDQYIQDQITGQNKLLKHLRIVIQGDKS